MACTAYSSAALSRIQLDHQTFVDRGRQIGTRWKRLEPAFHFLCIDLDPLWEAARFGSSDSALDAKLLLRLCGAFAVVARPHLLAPPLDALPFPQPAFL